MPRKARAKPKPKPTAPPPVTWGNPMPMMIVSLARGWIAGKRGEGHVTEPGPVTDALAALIMRHDVKTLGKITPAKLEEYERTAATVVANEPPPANPPPKGNSSGKPCKKRPAGRSMSRPAAASQPKAGATIVSLAEFRRRSK